MKSVAFIGHIPNKLYRHNPSDINYIKLNEVLYKLLIKEIFFHEADIFITGGSLGFDALAFNVVEKLKKDYEVYQMLAIPFRNQLNKWLKNDIDKYNCMKKRSTCVYVDELKTNKDYSVKHSLQGEYHPSKIQKRNEWMIDICDMLIVCWNGFKHGDTWNCLKYAKKLNKEIVIVNPKTFKVYNYL